MRSLTLGVLFPLSGTSRDTSLQCVEAARVGVEWFTPPGWTVRVVEGDAKDPDTAGAEAERLIGEEGAQVILGTLRSELSLPASAAADRLGAVYWEAIASADEVTTRGLKRVFRVDGRATGYAAEGVDFLADVLVPRWGTSPSDIVVGAAVEETPFPQSFGRAAIARAQERGFATVPYVTCRSDVDSYTEQVEELRSRGVQVLLSAGFNPMVARLWRQLVKTPLGLRALIGISNWAFPRDPELRQTGYERVFAIGAPYLFTADRTGLPSSSRELLERWWASSATPPGQGVAVDRDLVFTAAQVLLSQVLPLARDASPATIADAARSLDVPAGGTAIGYGVRFDEAGNNERSYALIMQWRDGQRLTVHPPALRGAELELAAPAA